MISFASNQRSAKSRSLGGVVENHTPEAQFEAPYAPLYPLSYYGMAAQRYLHVTARRARRGDRRGRAGVGAAQPEGVPATARAR